MSLIRIKPRSSIADPDLARAAVVDLPAVPVRRLRAPTSVLKAFEAYRGPVRPEPVIILTLVPVIARRR